MAYLTHTETTELLATLVISVDPRRVAYEGLSEADRTVMCEQAAQDIDGCRWNGRREDDETAGFTLDWTTDATTSDFTATASLTATLTLNLCPGAMARMQPGQFSPDPTAQSLLDQQLGGCTGCGDDGVIA